MINKNKVYILLKKAFNKYYSKFKPNKLNKSKKYSLYTINQVFYTICVYLVVVNFNAYLIKDLNFKNFFIIIKTFINFKNGLHFIFKSLGQSFFSVYKDHE